MKKREKKKKLTRPNRTGFISVENGFLNSQRAYLRRNAKMSLVHMISFFLFISHPDNQRQENQATNNWKRFVVLI